MTQDEYLVKKERLIRLIEGYTRQDTVVAFSGGVDSTAARRKKTEKKCMRRPSIQDCILLRR